MPLFYDFDKANAKLPEVRETLLRLRAQRDEIVGVRDRIVELNAPALAAGAATYAASTTEEVAGETGLVDFPALVSGRPVWLCWRLGEERVQWWHETTEGFDSRRRIEDLV